VDQGISPFTYNLTSLSNTYFKDIESPSRSPSALGDQIDGGLTDEKAEIQSRSGSSFDILDDGIRDGKLVGYKGQRTGSEYWAPYVHFGV
jgi:hypothetical protein